MPAYEDSVLDNQTKADAQEDVVKALVSHLVIRLRKLLRLSEGFKTEEQ